MEALQVNEGFYEYGDPMNLGGHEVRLRRALPCQEKSRMALDLAQAALVFDDDLGVVYEGYTYDLALVVCIMRYYSDLDMSEYVTEESWYGLADMLESNSVLASLNGLIHQDLLKVIEIYNRVKDAAKLTFERRHSLSYRAGKAFGSILTDEDLTTTISKAEGVNSTMIDLLASFQQVQSPQKMANGGLIQFAKRTDK